MEPESFRSGRVDSYASRAAYLRLAIGDVAPPEIDRVLYLDADTRVVDDLKPLLETDPNGKTIGAAHDLVVLYSNHWNEVRRDCSLRADKSYLNSG